MRTAARAVTVIPSTINPVTRLPEAAVTKRRVAGYARVSTDSDEQFTSYQAQVDYYTQFIKSKPEWTFVDVYTDEGISGTNTKHRAGFNKMIEDALAGKIDLIVTKSISRFARNTVDTLTNIRNLKEHNVEVFFEKENIYTFDSKGEVMITIMSSLAQEESRSISENVTWGHRKRFADGKVSLGYSSFLGYEKGPDKDHPLVIVEDQAEIVRRIYTMFIDGKTPFAIAKILTEEGIPTPAGKTKWGSAVVESILSNEKYKGSALLQKSFTVDFLQHKMKENQGEVPQYFIEHSHEAIIPPEDWQLVQLEIARRKSLGRRYSGNSVFGARLICEDCGGFFGAKTWNSTNKYRRTIWQCNDKFKDKEHRCTTPHLTEDEIKERFLRAYNTLISDRENLLDDCRRMIDLLTDTSAIDAEIEELVREAEDVTTLTRKCIEENAAKAQSQEEFAARYKGYEDRYEGIKKKVEKLQEQKAQRQDQAESISAFMFELHETDEPVAEFDSKLWLSVIDHVLVKSTGVLVFRFRNGTEVEG
jgi:site-specific DNA recombinase